MLDIATVVQEFVPRRRNLEARWSRVRGLFEDLLENPLTLSLSLWVIWIRYVDKAD